MRISIKFSLVKTKTSDYPIRMRITYDGIRLDIRTGYVCPPDCWDEPSMRMLPGTKNRYNEKASIINRQLSKFEGDINNLLMRYEVEGSIPEPNRLKEDFFILQGKATSSSDNLSELMKKYIIENGNTLSTGSIEAYRSLRNKVSTQRFAQKPTNTITSNDLQAFMNDLWNEGRGNHTVSHYIDCIKIVLRWARRNGLYQGTLPEDFKPNIKTRNNKQIFYLEWQEFEKIYNLDLSIHIETMRYARDIFCMCCATGLRISDCNAMRWSDIILDSDHPNIHIFSKKSKKYITIELNKYSRAILDKYPAKSKDSFVFPRLNLEHRQPLLSSIARLAQLDRMVVKMTFVGTSVKKEMKPIYEIISTHWGRHTFIVHALRLGIPPAVIMSWTGHSNFDSMKPYFAITNDAKVENMAKFD